MLRHSRVLALAIPLWILASAPVAIGQAPALLPEEIEQFLLTAEIVDANPIGKGITSPWRLTLSNGTVTHDAAFQSVNVRRESARVGNRTELRFADSYHFNIAAYRIARLLRLDHMIPVTVEREWRNQKGALGWYVDSTFDEKERLSAGRVPPDLEAWQHQTYRMHVFAQLVYDTDRNQGNILYTPDWKLWMIDFTRAFRPWSDIHDPKMLHRCDRDLFERLQALRSDEVRDAVGPHLTTPELGGVMERRDRIVEFFRRLIDEKGEAAVLY